MEEKLDIWWLNEESEQMLNRGYLLKGETAVSYTHLDVYKRQIFRSVDFPEPELPIIDTNSPSPISRFIPLRTWSLLCPIS